jgi:alpha-ketoglutarate-dependent taurine dioxygenase
MSSDIATHIEIRTLPGEFGAAEVIGLSVPGDIDDSSVRELLRSTVAKHAVVCLRIGEKLSKEVYRSVVEMLGPVKNPIGRTRDGGEFQYSPELQVVDSGFVMTDEIREKLGDLNFGGLDPLRPGLFETWHTDDTYLEEPASLSVLHARVLPSTGGGATMFLDMRKAYELLPPAKRSELAGLRAVHVYDNEDAFLPRVSSKGPGEALVPAFHPIVRTHEIAGTQSLYFDLDRASHVDGVSIDEGRALLWSLQEHAEANAPRYAHDWVLGDILIWDNASVQHKASGDFPVGEPRRFWRHMVVGSAPVESSLSEAASTEAMPS